MGCERVFASGEPDGRAPGREPFSFLPCRRRFPLRPLQKPFSHSEFDSKQKCEISRKQFARLCGSLLSLLGTFSIIEHRRTPIILTRRTARFFPGRIHVAIWIVLLAMVAFLGWAANVSAAADVEALAGKQSAAQGSVLSQSRQYHAGRAVQYQQGRAAAMPVSAWNQTPDAARELVNRLISPFFSFDFAVSNVELQKPVISRSRSPFGIANDRSIADRISARTCSRTPCLDRVDQAFAGDTTNERLMLQIGGLFGTFYVAFLAVWFWATRVRGRPPSGAHT